MKLINKVREFMTIKIKGRGGRRAGAGRKKVAESKLAIGISISIGMLRDVDRIRGRQNRSSWIRDLIENEIKSRKEVASENNS